LRHGAIIVNAMPKKLEPIDELIDALVWMRRKSKKRGRPQSLRKRHRSASRKRATKVSESKVSTVVAIVHHPLPPI
jgi:hypothetical protein